MIKFGIIVSILVLGIAAAQDPTQDAPQCGKCQTDNEVLCATNTSYFLCFDGKKFGEETPCDKDHVCSNTNAVCEPIGSIDDITLNVCGDNPANGMCGKCDGTKKYTCVSPTQAARCIGEDIAAVFNCKEDEICVASADPLPVCVPQCAADFFKYTATCSADSGYTTTTQTPPTTPKASERLEICMNAAENHQTLYFYEYADTTCKNAVYCQRSSLTSTDWVTIYRTCPSSTPYFDTSKRDCVTTKPASCSNIVTTTTNAPSSVPVSTTTTIPTTTTNEGPADTTIPNDPPNDEETTLPAETSDAELSDTN